MLETFRSFIRSKVGAFLALIVLALTALAFASSDVANTGNFGGVAGGDRVATVGGERISTGDLRQAATNAVENARQDDPRMSMKAFLSMNGLDRVLDDMISRTALSVFGRENGIVAGERLVDSEIAKISAFKGPDGRFSEEAYRQLLQQRGLTDQQVREDLGQGLVSRMVLLPAGYGAVVPTGVARHYAALLQENRKGEIGVLPAEAFQPNAEPTAADLQAWYTRNRDRFIRPERRTVRYALFTDAVLGNRAAPSDAEIAARYNADKARYQAVELRRVTQLVLPSQEAARTVASEAAKGTSLDSAARSRGLATSSLGPLTKSDMAAQASPAVADAVFAATKGAVAGPVRGALGWTVLRIDGVENRAGKTLEQARAEIVAVLSEQKRRAALADLSAQIEEEFDNGGNLGDAAKKLGVQPQSTPALTADGRIYGQPGSQASPDLVKVVQAAFAMEREGQPQIAEMVPGKTYIMFDVTEITPSAAAPLAEIKESVVAEWRLERGSAAAKTAAAQVLAAVKNGASLQAAFAALGRPLPGVDQIAMNRQQLTSNGGQVPPPLMLMFSMAKGTVKLLPAPGNRGWFVVALKTIETRPVNDGEPIVSAARRELGGLASAEYAEQLRRAIRSEVGATRNAGAIKAVGAELGGTD